MLLPSQPLPSVPDDTACIACAAFRRGNPYVLLQDKLGAVFADADFADLYPKLGLDLADAGFDFSILCEFRARLLQHKAAERLFDCLLDAAREGGLLKVRGRSRTNSTHVLAAVRTLNRLELVGETLRAALNGIAVAAPDWLRGIAPADWHKRYDRRVEDMRLPEAGSKREAYAVQVGTDGFVLLDAIAKRSHGVDVSEADRGPPGRADRRSVAAASRRAAPRVGAALRAGWGGARQRRRRRRAGRLQRADAAGAGLPARGPSGVSIRDRRPVPVQARDALDRLYGPLRRDVR